MFIIYLLGWSYLPIVDNKFNDGKILKYAANVFDISNILIDFFHISHDMTKKPFIVNRFVINKHLQKQSDLQLNENTFDYVNICCTYIVVFLYLTIVGTL